MPVIIPNNLPAKEILSEENIFVMSKSRAQQQDIRPLKILILNLMPNKVATETQLLRLLSNTPIQIEVTLIHMKSHISKNTSHNHLSIFYRYWEEIREQNFDGMIITGAPVENLDFTAVDYWDELCGIMEWTKRHVFSTIHICWGAQAGLYYHYGVPKHSLRRKKFGVFLHWATRPHIQLLKGFDDRFGIPHSRHTETRKKDIAGQPELSILAESKEAGPCVISNKDGRQIFITGHLEYDSNTLREEYERDLAKGLPIEVPKNYFPNDNPKLRPIANWKSAGNLFYYNWLNFYVYQETPFDLQNLMKG